MVALRKIYNESGAYSISTAVPIDSVVKNTDPYISYMSEWNDEFWYQGKLQKYINTPEGNIEVSTGRKMSFSYYYTSKDHLGSIWHYWNSLSNKYSNIYYPSGIMREKRRSPYNYGLTGKEIVYDNGLDEYFFGARTLFAPINRFNQPDPLCEEYYHISPYAYCANNFINALDPDGRDWYEANNGKIIWTNYTSQKDLDDNKIEGKYLGQAYVVFNGSKDEKLGSGNNFFGEGAKLSEITVYGPQGASDIQQYQGYSMSSDPSLFGVVAEGTYIVNRLNPNDRKGPYQSEWTLNNRGKVPANGNINPAHPERNPGYLTGVFIHRPNNNGFAGTYLNKKTNKISGISEGCLLISPKQWDKFNAQLNNIKNFRLQLIRK